jgi:hypothetical protein
MPSSAWPSLVDVAARDFVRRDRSYALSSCSRRLARQRTHKRGARDEIPGNCGGKGMAARRDGGKWGSSCFHDRPPSRPSILVRCAGCQPVADHRKRCYRNVNPQSFFLFGLTLGERNCQFVTDTQIAFCIRTAAMPCSPAVPLSSQGKLRSRVSR